MMWVRSADWLYKVSSTTASSYALAEGCIDSWEVIPWDEPVPGFSPCVALHSLHLAKCASNEWVDDEIMNAGLDFITCQLGEGSRILVANCLLLPYLRISWQRGQYRSPCGSRLDAAVIADTVDEIHFPVHVHGNHWTLLTLNVHDCSYSYTDSRDPDAMPPTDVPDLLVWWLRSLSHSLYTNTTAELFLDEAPYDAPSQTDNHSCGIVVLSTLAAYLLEYEPWSQDEAATHRLLWYARLSEALQDDTEVCILSHKAEDRN